MGKGSYTPPRGPRFPPLLPPLVDSCVKGLFWLDSWLVMMVAKSFVVVNELVEYENVQSAAAGREKRRGGRGSAAALLSFCVLPLKKKMEDSRISGRWGSLFVGHLSDKCHIDALHMNSYTHDRRIQTRTLEFIYVMSK